MTDWIGKLDAIPSASGAQQGAQLLVSKKPQKLRSSNGVENVDLTDKERMFLRAKNKLTTIAGSLKYPVDDLIDFYQNDMSDIARMDIDAVTFIVRDYIQYRKACRCKPENELNEAT